VHVPDRLSFLLKFLAAKCWRSTTAHGARRALDDGRDFVPTNRWVVFGHHFAAIPVGTAAGPTLASVRLSPRTMWILAGVVLGRAVQIS
jgi:carbon starvation protein